MRLLRDIGATEAAITDEIRQGIITVYGRKPVLEALEDPALEVRAVFVAKGGQGQTLARIKELARQRGLTLHKKTAEEVGRISRNQRHDQGVAADVVAPRMVRLEELCARVRGPARRERHRVLVLAGVHNPQNVGMILRCVVAFDLEGIVVPDAGSPDVNPQVIKASSGTAFRAPVLRCATPEEAVSMLKKTGFKVYGLSADATETLAVDPGQTRLAFVLGNETTGIAPSVAAELTGQMRIALPGPVESLNVAMTAAIVCHTLGQVPS